MLLVKIFVYLYLGEQQQWGQKHRKEAWQFNGAWVTYASPGGSQALSSELVLPLPAPKARAQSEHTLIVNTSSRQEWAKRCHKWGKK